MAFNVQILHIPGCDFAAGTVALVSEISDDFGLSADLQVIEVRDQEQAEALQFLGSPTVQINGQDIDPAVRNSSTFGFF
jgi:hypothetical protein